MVTIWKLNELNKPHTHTHIQTVFMLLRHLNTQLYYDAFGCISREGSLNEYRRHPFIVKDNLNLPVIDKFREYKLF